MSYGVMVADETAARQPKMAKLVTFGKLAYFLVINYANEETNAK